LPKYSNSPGKSEQISNNSLAWKTKIYLQSTDGEFVPCFSLPLPSIT
jgi:hypothetical protein